MMQKNHSYYLKSSNIALREFGECGGALTALMKFLLKNSIVDGVLAVKKGFDIYDAVPVLVTEAQEIMETAGSLHCGTLNIAKILVQYLDDALDTKLAITVKPCEARTIMEIAKRGKINLNNIIMLGVNCGGTFPPVTTRDMIGELYEVDPDLVNNEEINQGKFIVETEGSIHERSIDELEERVYGRRSNCRRCEMNIPNDADLGFGNWGVSSDHAGEHSFVEVFTTRGAEILNSAIKSGYLSWDEPKNEAVKIRKNIDKSMVNLAKNWQDQDFMDKNDILSIFEHFKDEFQGCIKCMGCRDACPICYCQECTLEKNSPEWINQGEIPPSPLFHLERLIHMVESCTNCGQCEDVCPAEIPLAKIWHQISLRVNELNYSPGINKEEEFLFNMFKRPE